MNYASLKDFWLSEEIRTFDGWDFSYIANRTIEEPLPWDYKAKVHFAANANDLRHGYWRRRVSAIS